MIGRSIQLAGIFFGILSGLYAPRSLLSADADLWLRVTVAFVVGLAVCAAFYEVGAAVSRRSPR